ncbi:hypothetical protein lerEdw1_011364 [Lerista edwardsae]|nr:hypothetical protein lerEdw1_011364 [Lerista edwardsae]
MDAVAVDKGRNLVVYGVLGHPGFLHAPLKVIPADLRWFKKSELLARIKDKIPKYEDILSSYDIFPNGTLKIKNLTEGDAGTNYKVEAHDNDGVEILSKKVTLVVEDPIGDMFFYLIIGGSIVVFIVFLAVLIYCIRKKRAKRRKVEAEERELQTRIAVENGLKYRKLPQPPVRGVSNQPPQQQKPPPPQSEAPLQAGPPQPRPRPHQKPPRRMREKP